MKKMLFLFLLLLSMASEAFASLALDGNCTGSAAVAAVACTLTTASSNDVIVIFTHDASASADTVSTVSDTAGLTWAKRKSLAWGTGGSFDTEEWYAIASSPVTSDVITVTYSASASHSNRIFAFGISGANTSTPFDTDVSLPASSQFVDTTKNISATISTANSNTMLLGYLLTFGGFGTITYPSGFAQIVAGGTTGNPAKSIVSATQSSVTETWSWTGSSTARALLFDAVQQAAPAASSGMLLNSGF